MPLQAQVDVNHGEQGEQLLEVLLVAQEMRDSNVSDHHERDTVRELIGTGVVLGVKD
jgi:hypothetical protein